MIRCATIASILVGLAALAAPPAHGAPDIVRLVQSVKRHRQVRLELEASLAAPGEVRVTGTVNGREVRLVKRVRKAGSRTFRLKVDPSRLGLKKLTVPLDFDLRVEVQETGGAAVTRDVNVDVPVPVIFLGGLGNETTPGAGEVFAAALDLAAGGVYDLGSEHPDLVVHEYPSLTTSIPKLGKGLHSRARKLLKGSAFAQVDVVGFSMGGLVARSWVGGPGAGRCRNLVLLATPNEGSPLAYLAVELTSGNLAGSLGGNPLDAIGGLDALGELGATFLSPDAQESVRSLYPTYPWFTLLLAPSAPQASPVLLALNAAPPDPRTAFHALAYSDVPDGGVGVQVGTLETLNVLQAAQIFAGGTPSAEQVLALLDGSGDGVVPLRSAFLADVPAWFSKISRHDMGDGTHVTLLADAVVITRVAQILTGN